MNEIIMTYVSQIIQSLDNLNYLIQETIITGKKISVIVINKADASDIIRVNILGNVTGAMCVFQIGKLETIVDHEAIEWKYIRFPVNSVFTQQEMSQLIGLFVKKVQLPDYSNESLNGMDYTPLGQMNADIMSFIKGAIFEYCLESQHQCPAEYMKTCIKLVWEHLNAMDVHPVSYTDFERTLINRVERIFMD